MIPAVGAGQRRSAPRFTLLGPAMVAAVAYVDPGNVATNTSAGSKYGYLLLWVLVLATIVAGVMQYLSAALGAATGSHCLSSSANGSVRVRAPLTGCRPS